MRGLPVDWPFVCLEAPPLEPLAYDMIAADPAWNHDTWDPEQIGYTPRRHYRTMSIEEIAALPVGALAKRDCLLALWITAPHFKFYQIILAAWGFEFSTVFPWVKTDAEGEPVRGTGWRVGGVCEFLIIATRGAPKTTRFAKGYIETALPPAMFARRLGHSEKPAACYRWLEGFMSPAARRCELFSRVERKGWEVWGDEVGKLEAEGGGR